MKPHINRHLIAIFVLTILSLLYSSCAAQPTTTPTAFPTVTTAPTNTSIPTHKPTVTMIPSLTRAPSATCIPLAALTWQPGDRYFSLNGQPAFLFSRNPAGWNPADWETLSYMGRLQGDHFVRLGTSAASMGGFHGYGYTPQGGIQEDWSDNWEHLFDVAESYGLYVLPTFGGWIDWNDTGYNTWADNPFNRKNGGPATNPGEIFKKDSPAQQLYLQWFKDLVTRWSAHRNILAWEVVTEVNLINGITQAEGIYLGEQLVQVVHEIDPLDRPATASVADYSGWSDFLRDPAFEFISLHPYALPDGRLDHYLLNEVRQYMDLYHKPVLIGESGLRAATPDSEDGKITILPNALTGIQHAIWADLVSGAMNGRALWWEDGYGIYFQTLGMPWMLKYREAEAPVVRFSAGLDMSGFKPVQAQASARVFGAALGNEQMIIGWYRDAACEPPDWSTQNVLSKQAVILTAPGMAADWQVDFYNAGTGTKLGDAVTVARQGGTLTVTLPDFSDDIAFKVYAQK
jgi:hypothetical protein